jgi:hypothetical protein
LAGEVMMAGACHVAGAGGPGTAGAVYNGGVTYACILTGGTGDVVFAEVSCCTFH